MTVQPTTINNPQPATSNTSTSTSDQSDVLVKVEGVGKRFCKDLKRSLFYGVQDVWNDLRGKGLDKSGLRKREFWANKDISFELRRGECLGLIGRNGAGKTTLLKMLNGLIKPDEGRIEIKGRVGALIALGAGFNPILTGRENVYVAASVYGLSKTEIDAKYEEIVEFAEMAEFMESPVQNYSSGMKVKLGFAVATAFKPDVLLVDEVLAVGDAAFRFKSLRRIKELLKNSAVIFVSHNEVMVRQICSKGIFLQNGITKGLTDIDGAFFRYHDDSEIANPENPEELALGHGISNPRIRCSEKHKSGEDLNISVEFTSEIVCFSSKVRVLFMDEGQYAFASYDSESHGIIFNIHEGRNRIEVCIPKLRLKNGKYFLNLILMSVNNLDRFIRADNLIKFSAESKEVSSAPLFL